MKENKLTQGQMFRWKQFSHKEYAVFCSLKEFNIGVLAVSSLTFTAVDSVSTQDESPAERRNYEPDETEATGTHVPLTEAESAKMVTVLSRADIQAAAVHPMKPNHVIPPKTSPPPLILYLQYPKVPPKRTDSRPHVYINQVSI